MKDHATITYFSLIYAAALPLIVLGFIFKTPENTPLHLPASAVMFVLPGLIASILTVRRLGRTGLRKLWAQLLDKKWTRHAPWYLVALGLMPAVAVATYAVFLAVGLGVQAPSVTAPGVLALAALYLVSAILEEIGWMGYAFKLLEKRWQVMNASLILGVLWSVMHIVPWIQVHGMAWAMAWAVFSILIRTPMTWLYLRTGRSILAVVLVHMSINLVISLLPGFTDSLYYPWAFACSGLLLTVAIALTKSLRRA